MASTIAAITTGVGGVVTTADATGNLSLLSGTTTVVAVTSTGAAVTGTLSASGVSTFAAGTALLPALTTTGDTNTGVWFPAADTIAASTGGTERMRIDSSGNVGIGTSSPAYKLHTAGIIGTGLTGTNGSVAWKRSSDGVEIATIATDGTTFNYNSGIQHVFKNSGSEVMRIDSSGNVLVGCTAVPNVGATPDQFGFSVSSSEVVISKSTSGTIPAVYIKTIAGASKTPIVFYNGINAPGSITTTPTATAYNTSSDYRLKENIVLMTGALNKVAKLKPVTYTWKVDGSEGEGFIAHELQAVVPNAVVGEKDAVDEEGNIKPQGIDTSFLVATLTAAIQEQQTIINDLKARITALEAK